MKNYSGNPETRTVYVEENGQRRRLSPQRSQRVWNHSPDGFNWGYGGSGPAQLALAILLEHGIETPEATRMYQRFKSAKIAILQIDEAFTLTAEEINAWIAEWRTKNN